MIATARLPEIKTELPGPKAREILEKDHRYISPSYTRPFPFVMKRGSGAIVEDVDGNLFLDFNAGVAVCSTGHSHPEVVEAINKQAAEFLHIGSADYYYPQLVELAEKLEQITPGDFPKRVHFGNSGAEAVETAVKLAMYATGRSRFIAFYNAFHGRTLGALSLTASKSTQRRGFIRQLLDVTHIPYGNCLRCPYKLTPEICDVECGRVIEDLLFKTTVPRQECAAIVVEPIQGEGGYVVPQKRFLQSLRRIASENGILLIVDEVQSGMGRTGKFFACQHFDLVPDIVCIAKGIASGLPLSATVARADLMDWHVGAHASTFGGNPVAIAAAMKTIELLERELIENAADVGDYLMRGLQKIKDKYEDCIAEVRGLGLMIGVEFVEDIHTLKPAVELRDRIELECFKRGLILIGCGESAIRFSPPLVVERDQVDCTLAIFDEAIAAARNP